ncbi:hypothetical protein ACFL49_00925 [Candidatus Omnitrophota bacterium]
MTNNIIPKHDKIFDFLVKQHDMDNNLIFVPRKINNKGRLSNGCWFIGGDKYLQVSFWKGQEGAGRIHNISFVVRRDGNSYIELAGQDSVEKTEFLKLLLNKLGGFKRYDGKDKWYREYSDNDYISNLKHFLQNDKPVIDGMIRKHNPRGISFPDEKFYEKYVGRIIEFRKKQNEFGDTHKVVRICWNTEGWKFPSGLEGKSKSLASFERENGYGHEEWLFDKSRAIDGYHYAFLQPLNVESGKHVGKTYSISLFTKNNDGRTFYVGDIKNAECISENEATAAHKFYKDSGWIEDMVAELKEVGANHKVFLDNLQQFIFNVKFKFDDVNVLDEMEEISEDDRNVTSYHLKLLPKKSDFATKNIPVTKEKIRGKQKDESVIKVVYSKKIERVQYHNRIQNALVLFLEESRKDEYSDVYLEDGRVDIKAKTHGGSWHFFEVKTSNPKLCIREALGQIMEYAYWPEEERAEKLIIVGDSRPTKDDEAYLQHIRNKFKIPVCYSCFDLEKKILSEEY